MGTSRSCVSWRHTRVGQHGLEMKSLEVTDALMLDMVGYSLHLTVFNLVVLYGCSYSISLVAQVTCPAVVSLVTVRSSPAPATALGKNII